MRSRIDKHCGQGNVLQREANKMGAMGREIHCQGKAKGNQTDSLGVYITILKADEVLVPGDTVDPKDKDKIEMIEANELAYR